MTRPGNTMGKDFGAKIQICIEGIHPQNNIKGSSSGDLLGSKNAKDVGLLYRMVHCLRELKKIQSSSKKVKTKCYKNN